MESLFSTYQPLTYVDEGEIGLVRALNNQEYIVKSRTSGRLNHEYHIGLKLNELSSPHFVRTYSLFHHPTKPNTDVLLLSKAAGVTTQQILP